ncbi:MULTISPECIES: retropepsin-like aspartic protease [Halomonas]|uniref:Retroviral-like aspartic protease family protein n=3 Tax=Halomonas TaxID=2745 RepID=A0AAU7KFR0_9GAMM|nr:MULTISPECIES: retropepsin-like aspartic protease [Halomonas]MBR9772298.1 TIGR02281 family clan AA aspartic protease [Gammaproteobacteria bacterium]MBS8268833.1 TIGR02281 family clan AA aspartic protease [Halomonas litopenaei]MBY5943163.1 retroviral-like aspartic protease family protein [Halomonas sp. DP5N14-9]MBY6110434.1 retroviral-like aspartic protease family protein [Halomonas sp. DP1Y21-3]MCJ8285387.1 retroviral-like aspartic protease family protein [Halomonas sp.]
MTQRQGTRGPGLAMMLLFWVLFMGLGGWWATSWLEQRLNPNANLNQVAEGEPLRLKRGPGGHFVAPGSINGTPVTFLVDTGATRVALPGDLAARLSLPDLGSAWFHTANGRAQGTLTRLDSVTLGGLSATRVDGSISPGMEGETALLGMSFLGRFDIAIRGDILELQARGSSSPRADAAPHKEIQP